jgi:hypothetical protein
MAAVQQEPETVRQTRQVPFFINRQPFDVVVPTPTGNRVTIKPGQVVIGAPFRRCVDPKKGLIQCPEETHVSRIVDPLHLLDDLLQRPKKAADEPVSKDKCLGKSRGQWTELLAKADEYQVLELVGNSRKDMAKLAEFLGVDLPADAMELPKLDLARKLLRRG